MRILRNVIISLLLLNVVTPLVVWMGVVFPYIFPKAIFSRSLIEATFVCALVYAIIALRRRSAESVRLVRERIVGLARNPLAVTLGLFFVSLFISTLLAPDRFIAFWGTVERAEGLWGLLHILLFLILGSVFFTRKHWVLFFKLSLGVGIAISIRAFFEYLGVFGIKQLDRPDSFVGNAAFLATQMLFLIVFSAIVSYENNRAASRRWSRLAWRYGAPVLAFLFFITMFITRTRGALLGFAAGIVVLLAYYAFRKRTAEERAINVPTDRSVRSLGSRRIPVRTVSAFLLGFLIFFGVVFFFTRTAQVWQSIPGLDRLARTATFDTTDASTQTRLFTWRLSWDAFTERPLFGWGLEHYLVAYERHYNPNFAIYGETWLDRAHNKLIDVLVMQGAFGLLAYLALFGAALYCVLRLKEGPKALIIAGLVAYFIQNLVLFDQLLSYLSFFALLGYVLCLRQGTAGTDTGVRPKERMLETPIAQTGVASIFIGSSVLGILFLLFSLYLWNWVPLVQARLYKSATAQHSVDAIVATLARAMSPYNFVQANIRTDAIDAVYLDQFFYNDNYRMNPKYKPLGDILVQGMQDIVDRHPEYDVRDYIRLVEMLNGYARDDASYYVKAEPLLRKALELAPRRQEIYYHLAFNLAGQGRFDESIRAARYAVDMSPTVARAHFELGLMYAAVGDSVNGQKEVARTEELDPSLQTLMQSDRKTLLLLYNAWGMTEKAVDLVLRGANGMSDILDLQSYKLALRYYIERKDAAMLVKVATYVRDHFANAVDEMDVIIDLAKKGNWDIMSTL
jgi:O-antigen ligase